MRPPLVLPLAGLLALTAAVPAAGEVRQSAPDGFEIVLAERVAAPPAAVYAALPRVDQWWSGAHTYSGDAANLSLKAEPGGCFCERWAGGAVEHGRVILLLDRQAMRLQAALGPLQSRAVSAVLTFALKQEEGGTALEVSYRVAGSAAGALDKLAQPVEGVLAEQVRRLKRFAETGKAT